MNGTPADCVALGTHHWDEGGRRALGHQPRPQPRQRHWHSGTLAAAKQAALLGTRGIALSTPSPVTKDEPDFAALAPYVQRVLECSCRTTCARW